MVDPSALDSWALRPADAELSRLHEMALRSGDSLRWLFPEWIPDHPQFSDAIGARVLTHAVAFHPDGNDAWLAAYDVNSRHRTGWVAVEPLETPLQAEILATLRFGYAQRLMGLLDVCKLYAEVGDEEREVLESRGHRREGTLRDFRFRDGKCRDVHLMVVGARR